jgi:hypothetical protein
MSKSKNGPGLISTILGLTFLWVVLFGITCGSTHHRMNCTPNRGVEFNHEPAPPIMKSLPPIKSKQKKTSTKKHEDRL